MAGMINLTASALKTILCYIDAEKTPKIAFDNDEYALPLIEKIKNALGDSDGSQSVCVHFGYNEAELERQFYGVCKNIGEIFNSITRFNTYNL